MGSWHLGSPSCSSAEKGRHVWPARYSRLCPVAGVSALRDQMRERRGLVSILLRCKSNLLQIRGKEQRGWGLRARGLGPVQQGETMDTASEAWAGQNRTAFLILSLPWRT